MSELSPDQDKRAEPVFGARTSIWGMTTSSLFWQQRSLHAVVRLLLLLTIGVLLCVAIGFTVASGRFTQYDLLAVALYLGLASFAWYPGSS